MKMKIYFNITCVFNVVLTGIVLKLNSNSRKFKQQKIPFRTFALEHKICNSSTSKCVTASDNLKAKKEINICANVCMQIS